MPDVSTLARWARKAATTPPQQSARRAVEKLRGGATRARRRRLDLTAATYALGVEVADLQWSLTSLPAPSPGGSDFRRLDTERALRHEVDLLGSQAVVVRYGMTAAGFAGHRYPAGPVVEPDPAGRWLEGRINTPNLPEARRIWSLVDHGYQPIDWQVDFRSGWRWSEGTWSGDIVYGTQPGADVKVPWELARLQHLPRLALAAAWGEGGPAAARELRNELLDFIATNPPRFGVNWTTTMDVAIRAANIAIALDILHAAGIELDEPAGAVIRRSLLEHARHIAGNLEWDPLLRGNHYLADLVGLLIVARSLAPEAEAGGWLALAARELDAEIGGQFHDDGTNFEGSTSYHRLSGEMAIVATAVALGQGLDVPGDRGHRLSSIVRFSEALMDGHGLVPLIGDNDSGRFLQLDPPTATSARDHRHLVDALLGVVPEAVVASRPEPGLDRWLVEELAGGRRLRGSATDQMPATVGDRARWQAVERRIDELPADARATYRIPLPAGALDDLRLFAFPNGGYWIARSGRLRLAVRCGPVGQRGNGGHDHNDQLAFDLAVDDQPWIQDPGTFVYTADLELRNAYRSVSNHSGPLAEGAEPADLAAGPWTLGGAAPGETVAWGPFGFAGVHRDRAGRDRLETIELARDALVVKHGIEGGTLAPRRRTDDWRALRATVPFAPAYGTLAG